MAKKDEPVDGRTNPAACDQTKFAAFYGVTNVKKLPRAKAKVAANVTSTPITHQSGKGTRGTREAFMGVSKTAIIRWCAANGVDPDKCKRFLAACAFDMTDPVFAKNWRAGENGDAPDINRETAREILRLAK